MRTAIGVAIGGSSMGIFGILFAGGVSAVWASPGFGLGLGLAGGVGLALSTVFFVWSVSSTWFVLRNRVVDAPLPLVRFSGARQSRRCRCGAAAPVSRVVANTTNGIPMGTDTFHRCGACGVEFLVDDVWGLMVGVMAGTLLLPIGLILLPSRWSEVDAWSVTGVAFFGLGGLGGYGMAVFGAFKRWRRHPLVDEGPG